MRHRRYLLHLHPALLTTLQPLQSHNQMAGAGGVEHGKEGDRAGAHVGGGGGADVDGVGVKQQASMYAKVRGTCTPAWMGGKCTPAWIGGTCTPAWMGGTFRQGGMMAAAVEVQYYMQ